VPQSVLIVEDDADSRRAMRVWLVSSGYAVLEAGSVQEALSLVDDASCILLDLRLPDGSGVEVLEHVRARATGQRVIVMTAEPQGGPEVGRAEALSPYAILWKPHVEFKQINQLLSAR